MLRLSNALYSFLCWSTHERTKQLFHGMGCKGKQIWRNVLRWKVSHVLAQKNSNVRSYGQHEQEALLFSFLIYADRKQPLLRELDMVGINEKTLFPGLDGIGRYVERKFRFDYNEAVENTWLVFYMKEHYYLPVSLWNRFWYIQMYKSSFTWISAP